MAPSWSRSSLLAWLLYAQSGTAQDDSERFPLSGGIGTGINVKVTAGIDQSMADALKMDFELPGGGVPFRWFPKLAEGTIERSSELELGSPGQVQDWGKQTIDAQSTVTFDFLKTRYTWKVSVNGMPTPWFDFPVLTTSLITHLRIYQGFTNPMVTLSKPACGTACVSSECKEGCMQDGAAVDASNCFSSFPQDSTGSSNCSTMAKTNQDGGNCCSGVPESVDLQTVTAGTWIEVRGDADFVGRACDTFSQSNSGCSNLVGRPVRVDLVNTETRTLDCWAPPSTTQSIPYYALTPHMPIIRTAKLTQAEMQAVRDTGINYDSRLVTAGSGELKLNWYALAMHEQPGVADSEPWVPVIKDRWDYWCDVNDGPGIEVLIADVGTRLIDYVDDCTDLRVGSNAWEDRQGDTCQTHRDNNWCTEAGVETQAYIDAKPNNRATFSRNEKDDYYAPKACCGCGGGSLGGNLNNLPPPLAGMSASQVFVM